MARALPGALRELSGPAALILVATLGAPLAIGSVHLSARLALVVLLLVAFLWNAAHLAMRGERLQVGAIGGALLLLLGWTLLQWIPLPASVIAVVAPESWEAQLATARALGVDPPSSAPISHDGPLTAAAWLTLLAPTLAYLTVANLRGARQRRRLLQAIVVIGLFVLAVGLIQALLGATTIFGLYRPTAYVGEQLLMTSFVNPNHAGALLVLGACVALGIWGDLVAYEPSRAPLPMAAFLALSVGVLATMSRANAVAWAFGCLIIGLLHLRTWPVAERPRWLRGRMATARLLLLVGVPATLGLLLIGSDRWLAELATLADWERHTTERGHVTFWAIALDVARDHPWLGVGHGAFPAAAAEHVRTWQMGFAHHAHNLVLQGVAEWGLPIALLAGGLLVVGCGSRALVAIRRGDALAIGVAVGLGALVLQNQFDFSIWIPGVGLPAAVAAGWLSRYTDSTRRVWSSRPHHRAGLLAAIALVGAVGLTAADAWRHAPDARAEAWRAALKRGEARDDVTAALLRHPQDFQLHTLGALLAAQDGSDDVARALATRAVDLAPRWPEALLVRARLRVAGGDARGGAADLVLTWRQGYPYDRRAHDEAMRHLDNPDFLEAYLGADPDLALSAAVRMRSLGNADAAALVLEWAVARFPDSLKLREMLGRYWARSEEHWGDLSALATRTLAEGAEAGPERSRHLKRAAYFLDGLHFAAQGKHQEAYHMFLEASRQEPERALHPLIEAGYAAVRMERPDRLARILDAIREAGTPDHRWARARVHDLASRAAEARGDLKEALREAQAAIRARPRQAGYHERLAALFEAGGRSRPARRARKRAALLREEPDLDARRWANPLLEVEDGEEARAPRGSTPPGHERERTR
ncbi:MAG: O-antigen ligase family protein [Myxococcota bacterium]